MDNQKGHWKFFSLSKSSVADITVRESQLVTISTIAFCFVFGVLYFTNILPEAFMGLWALIPSMVAVIARFVFYAWELKKKGELDENYEYIRFGLIFGGCVFGLFVLFSLIYDIGFLALFSADWILQLFWFITLEYVAMLTIGLTSSYMHYRNKNFVQLGIDIAFYVTPLVALVMIFFGFAPPASLVYFIGIGVTVIFLIYLYRQLPPANRKTTMTMFVAITSITWLTILLVMDPSSWFISASLVEQGSTVPLAQIPAGQTTNYFSYIWYIFFQSPVAAIMIAIMTFGAVVTIFAKALGDLGGGMSVAIGAVLIVVPPLIIIMQILSGSIVAPTLLTTLLGAGVASFIFAIAEVGVFVIVAIILMTFTGMVEAFT